MLTRKDFQPTRIVLYGLALASLAACASTQPDTGSAAMSRPVVTQATVQAAPAPAAASAEVRPPAELAPPSLVAQSSAVELEQLIQDRKVSELRTTYNGSYGASLLFKADELLYYVALFQQKDFWRVFRTKDERLAEETYRGFSQQTYELAEADVRRIKLQAEHAHLEKELMQRANRLNALQTDLALQRQQEDRVAARQQQAQQDAAQLAAQQEDAQKQLRSLQRQIERLEAEQGKAIQGAGAAVRR
ncbi:DUF2968 family protein [Kerstersia gyiorum]|uniref:DUF2968 family protein n=1 Tax=Kerstersia gyiorum TaxID=206506 RepID=A0A4Q7MTP5_9BURK|nr:DUF2968 domain-containing protein [Kerstersia gyiorum]KAB0543357.1 DUF2968 domain-containing protein [Kerstersia gyiorum]QBR40494.1 DUF2968 domain-containing protein [Kerstersia gyiorum]RZS70322.1 DUF2968 family protein [Kerstersia gyiorum]